MADLNLFNAKRAFYFSGNLGYYYSVGYFALENFIELPKAVPLGNQG